MNYKDVIQNRVGTFERSLDFESLFNAQPLFWGDAGGARAAATAIINLLGSEGYTTGVSDGFFVPFSRSGTNLVKFYYDSNSDPTVDAQSVAFVAVATAFHVSVNPFTSFTISEVPVPAAVWLFGSGLIGLIGITRRKKSWLHKR